MKKLIYNSLFAIFITATALLSQSNKVSVNSSLSGRTFYVKAACSSTTDGSIGNPFGSLQEALAVASDGDTIVILPGTYFETPRITKKIVLKGTDEGSARISSTQSTPARLLLSSDKLVFDYFRLEQDLIICNPGLQPIKINKVFITESDKPFFIISNLCDGTILPPGSKCTVKIKFDGFNESTVRSWLRIESDAPDSPHLIQLSGIRMPAGKYETGYTAGNFLVNEGGAANYEIPLVIPPGTAGMEPGLSLTYDSRGKNGPLGIGWSLAGVSTIERCPTTLARNGFIDGIDFDGYDLFCLNNAFLVAVEGEYGNSGTIYRTERETFSKVISYGNAGGGPEYFKVWTKSGLIMEFGASFDSRIEAQGKEAVLTWAVNKIEDINGNYFTVTYEENNVSGEYYPIRIDYTGNTDANVVPYNRIIFEYEARPDIISGYISGSKIQITKRLKTIKTYSENQLVRTYNFEYELGIMTRRSRLISIQETAGNTSLPKTILKWQDGKKRFSESFDLGEPAHEIGNKHTAHWLADVNGDGRNDLVYNADGSDDYWVILSVEKGSSQATPWGTREGGVAFDGGSQWLADVNGDGMADLVYDRHKEEQYWVMLSTGNGFREARPWGKRKHGVGWDGIGQWVSDINGDARADIIYNHDGTNDYRVLLSEGNRFENDSYWGTKAGGVGKGGELQWLIDVNGDGMQDLLYDRENEDQYWVLLSEGKKFLGAQPWGEKRSEKVGYDGRGQWPADVNADGHVDIVFNRKGTKEYWVMLSNGLGFEANERWGSREGEVKFDSKAQWLADLNGDGTADFVYARIVEDTDWIEPWAMLSNGISFESAEDLGLPDGIESSNQLFDPVDINGDGLADFVLNKEVAGHFYYKVRAASIYPDLLISIKNGHGYETRIAYKPLTSTSIYTKKHDARYSDMDFQGPLYVVSSYSTTNGLGGVSNWRYQYEGLELNLRGLGFSGFHKITATDEQTGITNTNTYYQSYWVKTLPLFIEVRLANGTLIQKVENHIGLKQIKTDLAVLDSKNRMKIIQHKPTTNRSYSDHPLFTISRAVQASVEDLDALRLNSNELIFYPYLQRNIERKYEADGTLISTTTLTNEIDDYGNLTKIQIEYSDGSSQTTENTYFNDPVQWYLGQLTQTKVTAQTPGQETQIRTTSFEYHKDRPRLFKETIEPNTQFQLVKTYEEYDTFGNITHTTIDGVDIEARSYSTVYDSKGRFAIKSINPLGHIETRNYDPRFGAVIRYTDSNGLQTIWTYDDFGREILEVGFNGIQKTMTSKLCNSNECAVNTYYHIVSRTSGQSPMVVHYDILNRPIRRETIGFDGRKIFVDTKYNVTGLLDRLTSAYFNGNPVVWTSYEYDDLGRIRKEIFPNGNYTAINYQGATTITTNSVGHVNSRTVDLRGNLVKVTDALNNSVSYTYDSFGNLTTIIDPLGNTTKLSYDGKGRRASINDPDMGLTTFSYNSSGELISQKDAKNKDLLMKYDRLGRLIERTEPEGTTKWTYDDKENGIGKLSKVQVSNGNSENYEYDHWGRLIQKITQIDNERYANQITYDEYGRVDKIRYPTGLVIQNVYNDFGYLSQVQNPATGFVYWKLEKVNALGQYQEQSYGNGAKTTDSFEHLTGHLIKRVTVNANGSTIQNLEYVFDSIGNLTTRKDNIQNKIETFSVDALNRLTTVQVDQQNTLNVSYDAVGNIINKSDVGQYIYGRNDAGPHAVTKVSGIKEDAYTYDANGNRISNSSANIGFTSFNKPNIIESKNESIILKYGPTRQQFVKIVNKGGLADTTICIDGFYEKILISNERIHKHHIFGGDGLVAMVLMGGETHNSTLYIHQDILGSITEITDQAGTLVAKFEFDAWGKFRSRQITNPSIDGILNRGFTGHEHIGNNLILMRGRLYDSEIGRFLSADPFIQFADNPQNLNPYTYTLNNPLIYTDPSGYLFKWIGKNWRPIVAYSAGIAVGAAVFAGCSYAGMDPGLSAGLAAGFGTATTEGLLTALHGGSFKQTITSAAIGFAYGFAMGTTAYGIGGAFGEVAPFSREHFAKILVHGTSAAGINLVFGRDPKQGFISAAVAEASSPYINDFETSGGRVASTAVVSGVASELTGGDFFTGATIGAIQRTVNHELHFQDVEAKLSESGRKEQIEPFADAVTGLSVDLITEFIESPWIGRWEIFGLMGGTFALANQVIMPVSGALTIQGIHQDAPAGVRDADRDFKLYMQGIDVPQRTGSSVYVRQYNRVMFYRMHKAIWGF